MIIDDIGRRAFKTFVQAFLGILIPELCLLLDSGIEMEFPALIFAPMFCAALSAGISALWNFLLNNYFNSALMVDEVKTVDGEPVE